MKTKNKKTSSSLKTCKVKGFWDDMNRELEKLGVFESKEMELQSTDEYTVVFRPFEEKLREEKAKTEELNGEVSEEEINEVVRIGRERLNKKLVNSEGRYRVLGIDRFCGPLDDDADWVVGEYNTAEEAIGVAERKTREAKRSATKHSIPTVYYAYNPNGDYIGGDI